MSVSPRVNAPLPPIAKFPEPQRLEQGGTGSGKAEQSRILLVESPGHSLAAAIPVLEGRGRSIGRASGIDDAAAQASAKPTGMVILSGSVGAAGAAMLRESLRTKRGQADIPILVVAEPGDSDILDWVLQSDAADAVIGPIDPAVLTYRMEKLSRAARTESSLRTVKEQAEGAIDTIAQLSEIIGRQASEHKLELASTLDKLSEKERQLRHAQKMEALGQLAGGVAHEFNNQLTVMSGFARAALDSPDKPERMRECLSEVVAASDRAAILTGQMLLLSRDQVISPIVMDLGDAIENMYQVLRWAAGGSVDLVFENLDCGAIARADPVQLSQAMLNLAVNARDAMPQGGRLIISCDTVALDESFRISHHHNAVTPGDYVKLQVQDTGSGMDQATLDRIFDPFFTTKEAGKGTGLGLSVVFAIVEQCGGMIDVESNLGLGTAFTLYFPLCDEPITPLSRSEAHSVADGDGGTILLVEDEPAVRELVSMSLRSAGYDVLPALDGLEAIEVMREAGEDIELFITDVVMPGLSGTDLAAIFERDFPGRPVLFMSGYAPALEEHLNRNGDLSHFIGKPFKPNELVEKVNQIMIESKAGQVKVV
jgi:signal transduction histidine kinase